MPCGVGGEDRLFDGPERNALSRRTDVWAFPVEPGRRRRNRSRWRRPGPGRHRRIGRAAGADRRRMAGPRGAGRRSGHREDAQHRAGGADRRGRLPETSIPHGGDLRRADPAAAFAAARRRHGGADRPFGVLRDRGAVLGDHRLRRHVAGGARQRPGRRRGPGRGRGRRAAGHAAGLPHRRRGRHVHRGVGPVRRRRGGAVLPGRRPGRAGGLRLRRRAAGDVHAGRRRHLHQGRRRRRRPGRQGRAGHPRGRPAQPGHHRRQRGRQAWPPTCSSRTR